MKFSKRFRIVALVLCGGVVVASSACSVDSKTIAPSSASSSTTAVRSSPFAPTAAQKALIGVTDGTYKVTFDPKQDQVFSLGPNRLANGCPGVESSRLTVFSVSAAPPS